MVSGASKPTSERERTPTPTPEHVLSSVVQLAQGTKNPSTGKSSEPCASPEHITSSFSFVDDGSCSIYLLPLHTSCYLPEAQQRTAWSGLAKYRWSGSLVVFGFALCRCLAVWGDGKVRPEANKGKIFLQVKKCHKNQPETFASLRSISHNKRHH